MLITRRSEATSSLLSSSVFRLPRSYHCWRSARKGEGAGLPSGAANLLALWSCGQRPGRGRGRGGPLSKPLGATAAPQVGGDSPAPRGCPQGGRSTALFFRGRGRVCLGSGAQDDFGGEGGSGACNRKTECVGAPRIDLSAQGRPVVPPLGEVGWVGTK